MIPLYEYEIHSGRRECHLIPLYICTILPANGGHRRTTRPASYAAPLTAVLGVIVAESAACVRALGEISS